MVKALAAVICPPSGSAPSLADSSTSSQQDLHTRGTNVRSHHNEHQCLFYSQIKPFQLGENFLIGVRSCFPRECCEGNCSSELSCGLGSPAVLSGPVWWRVLWPSRPGSKILKPSDIPAPPSRVPCAILGSLTPCWAACSNCSSRLCTCSRRVAHS